MNLMSRILNKSTLAVLVFLTGYNPYLFSQTLEDQIVRDEE